MGEANKTTVATQQQSAEKEVLHSTLSCLATYPGSEEISSLTVLHYDMQATRPFQTVKAVHLRYMLMIL
jgi:hypothetical protein